MLKDILSVQLQGASFSNLTTLELFDSNAGNYSKVALVYGRNGSGKSTLAKAFKHLAGQPESMIVSSDAIDKNGNIVLLTDSEKHSIYVFDDDYVNENVRIQEDGLGSIVMLGEQADLTTQIEVATRELETAESDLRYADAELREYKDKLNPKAPTYYLEKIRKILQQDDGWAGREREIKGSRKNSSVLEDTYLKFSSLAPQKSRSELVVEYKHEYDELLAAKSGAGIITTDVPLLDDDLYTRYNRSKIAELLGLSIEQPSLTDRERYLLRLVQDGMSKDVQDRLEHFKNTDISYCPYCLQDITDEYRESLIQRVQRILTDTVKQHQTQLQMCALPEYTVDLSSFIMLPAFEDCNNKISQLNYEVQSINRYLQMKANNPFAPIVVELPEIDILIADIRSTLDKLEKERIEYNQSILKIDPIIEKLTRINNEIAYYDVIDLSKQLDIQTSREQTAQDIFDNASIIYQAKKKRLDDLDIQRKNVNIAIDIINNGLKYIFFSDDRLKIESAGESYRLYSRGQPVAPMNISMGERNIIGLCYFFASILREKSRETAYNDEYLILIDDPISSYDLENKIGILSFMKLKLSQFLSGHKDSRAIILTHDLVSFFDLEKICNELKREWENLFCGRKYVYNLKELNNHSIGQFNYNKRHEYTELIKLIFDYGRGFASEYDIVIGNIMRQVLEAFSTFEYKKGIENVSTDDTILSVMCDEHRSYFKNLMYRLVLNGGSHREDQVRNMELDFFSVISEQDKRRTAQEIICFIYLLNKMHITAHLGDVSAIVDSWCADIKSRAAMA